MPPTHGVGFQNAPNAPSPPPPARSGRPSVLGWPDFGEWCPLRPLSDGGKFSRRKRGGGMPGDEIRTTAGPASDNSREKPYDTALYAKGCALVDALMLMESWMRHS